ncbi:MAG: ABC transporter permease subunit [Acidilobaceae archaeon]
MRRAVAVAIKEFKNLVRDRYILLSVILAPFLSLIVIGSIYSISMRQSLEEAAKVSASLPEDAVVVLEDANDSLARGIASMLNANIASSISDALEEYSVVIVFHRGFSELVESSRRGNISILVKTSKPWSVINMMRVESLTSLIEGVVRVYLSKQYNISVELLEKPIVFNVKAYVKGGELDSIEATVLVMIMLAVGIAILILGMITLQVGAISIGMEREARTAEILLALPANRWEIVAGKTAGVIIVSMLAFLSFIAGGLTYIYLILPTTSIEAGGASSIDMVIQAIKPLNTQIASIILALTLHIVNSTLVGILTGVLFAGDIRGALTAGSYIGLALMAPLIPDISGFTLPATLEVVFTLTPYYPPYKLIESIVIGDYSKTVIYIIVIVAYSILLIFTSSKLMSGERLVYGIAMRRPKPLT